MYLSTGSFEHARSVLERFVEQRAYDPEGLCRLGMAYKGLKESAKAKDYLERCVVAARLSDASPAGGAAVASRGREGAAQPPVAGGPLSAPA